jgi:hypothetical protein
MMSRERPEPQSHSIRPRLLKMLPTTKRICLKCNKPFTSLGKMNRLCGSCNEDNISRAFRDGESPLPRE